MNLYPAQRTSAKYGGTETDKGGEGGREGENVQGRVKTHRIGASTATRDNKNKQRAGTAVMVSAYDIFNRSLRSFPTLVLIVNRKIQLKLLIVSLPSPLLSPFVAQSKNNARCTGGELSRSVEKTRAHDADVVL